MKTAHYALTTIKSPYQAQVVHVHANQGIILAKQDPYNVLTAMRIVKFAMGLAKVNELAAMGRIDLRIMNEFALRQNCPLKMLIEKNVTLLVKTAQMEKHMIIEMVVQLDIMFSRVFHHHAGLPVLYTTILVMPQRPEILVHQNVRLALALIISVIDLVAETSMPVSNILVSDSVRLDIKTQLIMVDSQYVQTNDLLEVDQLMMSVLYVVRMRTISHLTKISEDGHVRTVIFRVKIDSERFVPRND